MKQVLLFVGLAAITLGARADDLTQIMRFHGGENNLSITNEFRSGCRYRIGFAWVDADESTTKWGMFPTKWAVWWERKGEAKYGDFCIVPLDRDGHSAQRLDYVLVTKEDRILNGWNSGAEAVVRILRYEGNTLQLVTRIDRVGRSFEDVQAIQDAFKYIKTRPQPIYP